MPPVLPRGRGKTGGIPGPLCPGGRIVNEHDERSGSTMSRTGTTLEAARSRRPIPKTMRAGVFREKGIVRVEEVPVPEVRDGEALIKVAACGVCGTDIKKIFHAYVPPPQILDICAEIGRAHV